MGKFYEFKNKADSNTVDVYVYGAIVSGSAKWDDSDVIAQDFVDATKDLKSGDAINLFINSPGGSVFTASGIIAILQRAQEKGVIINAYIDGIAASAASFLAMAADNIYVYDTSILMIHRAISAVYGNADDFYETIDILEKLENSIIIPMYQKNSKDENTDFAKLMKAETWLDSQQISELFNVNIVENTAKQKAVFSTDAERHPLNFILNTSSTMEEIFIGRDSV